MTLFRGLLLAASTLLLAQGVQAQPWPVKPVRLIVSNAPGGAPDTMARLYSERLATALGQPIIVENRPAAGGIVAAEFENRTRETLGEFRADLFAHRG